MAKEPPLDAEKAAAKAAKKAAKKEKRSDTDGVHKSKSSRSKSKTNGDHAEEAAAIDVETATISTTTHLLNKLESEKPGTAIIKDDEAMKIDVQTSPPQGALVPFAQPLAEEKVSKKVLKSVKRGKYPRPPSPFHPTLANPKNPTRQISLTPPSPTPAAKHHTLRRGVKEVVKALRKSPPAPPSQHTPTFVVVLAADISPMDVISHLPVLCEDHGVPYIFVTSRVELGSASSTKRPTSVVMVGRERGGKKRDGGKEEEVGEGEWGEVFEELVKVVVKAGRGVRV